MKGIFTQIVLLCFSLTMVVGQSFHTRHQSLPCVDRNFSVVANVFVDSLNNPIVDIDTVNMALDIVNEMFSPICVSFEVCEFNVLPNYRFDTLGVNREFVEIQSKFNKDNRINLYFVNRLGEFPYLDWGLTTRNGINIYDGGAIVLEKMNVERILPHELGHFFGLLDTYEGGNELVNGSNCTTAGDLLCDTPADPYVQGSSGTAPINDVCEYYPATAPQDSNGDYYIPDVCNVMSRYEGDACSYHFSYEQLKLMADTYLNGPKLMW